MESLTYKKNYIETLVNNSPYTLFQWTFQKPGDSEARWTKCKVYNDINKELFWRKLCIYRSTYWSKESDELRLDLDYLDFNTNVEKAKIIVKALESIGISKYLVYDSGGKGAHIHLRYKYTFGGCSREEVRRTLYELLNLDVQIDYALFRTTQVLGCEGFWHRKTKKAKKIIFDSSLDILKEDVRLNEKYLTDTYLNVLPETVTKQILTVINSKETPKAKLDIKADSPPGFYKNKKFDYHFNRFKSIYLKLDDGRRRTLDMFIRYVYLTTKNEEVTKYYYKLFTSQVGINYDNETISKKVKGSIDGMQSNAIFIYKDVFDKEYFYQNYKNEVLVNE